MKITGKRVTLRPIRVNDAARFVKWFNDPEVHKFLARRKLNLKEEKKWIRSIPKDKNSIVFAIDTREGDHIGSIGLHNISRLDKFAVFGIMIGDKRYWSQGYRTEAMEIILDYGFKKLKLHRIELDVYDYNIRGIKLYKRLGFKMEGKKRERIRWAGKYYDVFQMGLLRKEWKR